MDEQLAAIYGTGNREPEQTDIEKMAAAELLVKLAAEEGVDLDSFNDQEIAEMINGLYTKEAEFPPKPEEKKEEKKEKHEGKESPEKEKKEEEKAAEKVAEADFLGRVIAHSMVQELGEIEKAAAEGEPARLSEALKKEKGPGFFERMKGHGKAAVEKAKEHGSAAVEKAKEKAPRTMEFLGKHKGKIGVGTAVAGTALAARHLYKKHHKTAEADASALEQLAAERAFAMAKEAGYIDEEGNFLVDVQPPQEEKQASALDLAVEQRALEICEANGIPVEWNKE